MAVVRFDCREFHSWESFHRIFAQRLGFPSYYGRNTNAWIDCMTYLDSPSAGMTSIHVTPPEVLVLQLDHVGDLIRRDPDMYLAIVELSSFVNFRKLDVGEPAVLALSFWSQA